MDAEMEKMLKRLAKIEELADWLCAELRKATERIAELEARQVRVAELLA